jgi:PAP2 superfamily
MSGDLATRTPPARAARGVVRRSSRLLGTWTAARRPSLLLELLIILCLIRVYDLARRLADVRRDRAVDVGEALLRTEQALHLAVERSWNVWVTGHALLSDLASWYYQVAHLTAALGALLWCWWARPGLYRGLRNALVLINVVGLAVFLALPVAPPRLLPSGGFVDAVAQAGFGASHAGPLPADQYGAMPSLHIAWAVWVCVVVHRGRAPQWVRVLALVHPVLTALVVVLTGNHYLLDIVGGALTAGLALALARGLPAAVAAVRAALPGPAPEPAA